MNHLKIEQKISPLIYKVRLADGTFTIIHVNRLKEVHGQIENGNAPPVKQSISKMKRIRQQKGREYRAEEGSVETEELKTEIPPHSQIVNIGIRNSSDSEESIVSSPGLKGDSEWIPGSSNLQRKLQDDNTTDGVAYRLRSRLVSRSEWETEGDKTVTGSSGNEPIHSHTSPGTIKTASSHMYNLRSRV
jgi:hypothetical protein